MSSDKCKNDVKTLFLICNSFGFALAWTSFASGVGMVAINGSSVPDIIAIVGGILIIFVTLGGYCGAITENKKTLRTYTTLMILIAVKEIIALVRSKPAPRDVGHNNDDMSNAEATFVVLIFITILTLVSILLAFVLMDEINTDDAENAVIPDKSDKREENVKTVATVKLIP